MKESSYHPLNDLKKTAISSFKLKDLGPIKLADHYGVFWGTQKTIFQDRSVILKLNLDVNALHQEYLTLSHFPRILTPLLYEYAPGILVIERIEPGISL